MLKKIKLYGELADKYGKEWELDINSPTEAIKALCANNRGFKEFLASSEERGMGYKVIIGSTYVEELKELGHPSGRQSIKIVPVVLGAGKGIGMVIIGILMVVGIGFVIGAAMQASAALAVGVAGPTMATMTTAQIVGMGLANASGLAMAGVKIGAGLILSGIGSMMAGDPTTSDAESNTSYGFSGPTNTTRQGVSVPVCYGQLMVGGVVISASLQAEEHVPEPIKDEDDANTMPFFII